MFMRCPNLLSFGIPYFVNPSPSLTIAGTTPSAIDRRCHRCTNPKPPPHSPIKNRFTGLVPMLLTYLLIYQCSSRFNKEITKIIEKLLEPRTRTDHQKWTPPSRDYMNNPLTCQTCKIIVKEVTTTLVCDACEKGYHLKCVNYIPKSISRNKWQEWHCVKCLSITNGKPLPPKYGHVMRNINTRKTSFIISEDQETEIAFSGIHECKIH
ncbi:hypothetical protein LXL04_016210 [Taraxacum kok-saghyz]